jgi:hypothetical protein
MTTKFQLRYFEQNMKIRRLHALYCTVASQIVLPQAPGPVQTTIVYRPESSDSRVETNPELQGNLSNQPNAAFMTLENIAAISVVLFVLLLGLVLFCIHRWRLKRVRID